ncbi:MAG: hypothetical protein DID90_2727553104 [Candidatus Nitrotoga sp. LAW]|nr:MAG: hypothetical protein DID90_2727553104 [Candidatus Nitrotoga sp. LAW]
MAAIREERDKARDLVKAGIDPRANKVATRIEAQADVDAISVPTNKSALKPSPSMISTRYGLRMG